MVALFRELSALNTRSLGNTPCLSARIRGRLTLTRRIQSNESSPTNPVPTNPVQGEAMGKFIQIIEIQT
jgi:hypothetical protein